MNVFVTICVLSLIAGLWLRATTHYILKPDRLLIKRAGLVWMEILFRDVEDMQAQNTFFSKLFEIRLYQLGFRGMLRIKRRKGLRYVLINPQEPELIVDLFRRFKAGADA